MVQKPMISCSSYLLLKKRSLRDACRQIAERHGRTMVPCGACSLADLCAAGPRLRGPDLRYAQRRSSNGQPS